MKEVLVAIMEFASQNPQIQTVKVSDGHTNEWAISSHTVELKKTSMGRKCYFKAVKNGTSFKIANQLPYAEERLNELLFYLTCQDPICIYSYYGERIVDDPLGQQLSGLYGLSLHQLKLLAKQENATPPKQHPNTKRSWVDAIRRHRLRQAGQVIPEYLTYYN